MNSRETANYITNMPFNMFSELLSNTTNAKKSLNTCERIMKTVKSDRPSDNRGNMRDVINVDTLKLCVNTHESMLTSKMVSLSIIFACPEDEPDFFEKVCEIHTSEDRETKAKTINYERIAGAYNTTVDNVKSNILFTEYKNMLKSAKTKVM